MADGGTFTASLAATSEGATTSEIDDNRSHEHKDYRVSYQFALGMVLMALVLQLDPGWWSYGFPLQSRVKPGNPLISLLELRKNSHESERVRLQNIFLYKAHGVRVSVKIEEELERLDWRKLPAIAVNVGGQSMLTEFGEEILADAYLRLRRPIALSEGFRQKQLEWVASGFLDAFQCSLPATINHLLETQPQLEDLSQRHQQEEFAIELLQCISLTKLIDIGNLIEQLAPGVFAKSWEALLAFKQMLDAGQIPLCIPSFWRELAFAIYRQSLKKPAPLPA